MTPDEISGRVKDFLTPHFPGHDLGADEDIFALGYVNSLFAMQLVLFIERDFGIELESADLDMLYFRSITTLTALVSGKTSVAS